MKQTRLFKALALVACLLCSLSATAAEAYACYTSSNTTLTFYYDDLRSSRTGTKYDLNEGTNDPAWKTDGTNSSVTRVVFDPSFANARQKSTAKWFSSMSSLQSISGMDQYLNTSQVTTMLSMFYGCSGLTSLNVSNFNTAKVTNMYCMFYECKRLTSLDVSNFNTAKVTSMRSMFTRCIKLSNLDLSNFNTSNVTTMYGMFYGCSGLTGLDLSSFNTSNVTTMSFMFDDCAKLTSLDLSSFNTSNVTDMGRMFASSNKLVTIYAGYYWSTAAVTSSANMFKDCTSLVGGRGTTYNASHIDTTYARIDRGSTKPGYLTAMPQPYAFYSPSSTKMTFYYDTNRSGLNGITYDLNTGNNNPGWYTDGTKTSVTQVEFDPSFASVNPTSTYNWFSGMINLTSITGIQYLSTSEVTTMHGMFYNCSGLTSLNVSNFNTPKVTDMSFMFYNCQGLTSLSLEYINTASLTTMRSMFSGCTGLKSLDLSGFNTANVKSMLDVFYNCNQLTSLDLSSFNTSNVTTMQEMFCKCSSLDSLDLSHFFTPKLDNVTAMFENCRNLKTIYVSSGWSTAAVTSSIDVFLNCTSLVGGAGTTYNANHTDFSYAHIDGGNANPGYLTESRPEPYACYTPSNTTLTFYYDRQFATRQGTTYNLNTDSYLPRWFENGIYSSVTRVVFDPSFAEARPTVTYGWFYNMQHLTTLTGMQYLNTSQVTDMSGMFMECSSLSNLDLSHFNTSNVTTMELMFYGCSALTSLDLNSFNTSKVTDMSNMFDGCSGLTSLDVSNFNTSKVTDMSFMFDGCSGLTSLNLSSFNTSKVTRMWGIFCNCSGLTSLDLGSFNTSNVINMNSMFLGCSGLTSLDLSHFDTANADDMVRMFEDCSGLTSLDLSSFNTTNVYDMQFMFNDCSGLATIYVGSDWSTARAYYSTKMFYNCTSLLGGQGTTYDENHVNKAYAHIDGGPSNPGYFSEKPVLELGDVSGDGEIDVNDVTMMISCILNDTPVDLATADMNGDNVVDVLDVTMLIAYILNN